MDTDYGADFGLHKMDEEEQSRLDASPDKDRNNSLEDIGEGIKPSADLKKILELQNQLVGKWKQIIN